MLQKITCQTCGGLLELSEDSKYGKCPFCQNEYHFKEEKAEALALMLNLGFENLSRHDFDGAISTFRSVAMNYPEDAEANWGLVISTYGIIFEKDDRTGKMIPTCSRIVEKSILENENYKKAIENAHPEQRPFYEEMAGLIEKKQAEIKEIMQNEESFDAFISFKATDNDGRPTQDSRYARKIYDELKSRGIKTFFSPVTLSTRAGEDYEPIIYKALNTCKLFILVATSEEYLNATWVKNEWTRFRDRMDEDKKAIVMPVYTQVEILRLMPQRFQRTQGIDLDRHAFDYDIVIADNAENILGIAERKRKEEEQKRKDEDRRAIEELQRQLLAQQGAKKEKPKKEKPKKEKPKKEKVKKEKVKKEKKTLTEAEKQAKKKKTKKAVTISLIALLIAIIITGVVLALTVFAPAKLVYERVDGGYAVSVNKPHKLEGELTIPSTHKGEPVVAIADRAFAGSSITSVTIPDSVNTLGENAFRYCTLLSSITIGDSVTTIESHAFYGCTSLTSVNYLGTIEQWCNISFGDYSANPLNNGAMLSLNGALVTDLVIPSTVTEIKNYAFSGCTSLTSVTLPNSVTTIGNSAFADCTSLTSVEIPSSVTSIGRYAFAGCTSLTIYCEALSEPSGWEWNWNSSYCPVVWGYDNGTDNDNTDTDNDNTDTDNDNTDTGITYTVSGTNATITGYTGNVTELVIPSTIDGYTITGVGASAFYGCTSLTSVTIPDSVTSIGLSAFYGCTSITDVTIGNGATWIGAGAFLGCTSLTGIIIPESVTSIGNEAFRNCTSLTSITIPNSVTSIGNSVLSGCPIENATIPISVISLISKNNLKTLVINGGDVIGDYLFYGCDLLTSVTIGDSVTSIENGAFSGCTSLACVTIPNSVTTIGSNAFWGCTSLASVNYLGTIEQWCGISFSTSHSNPLPNGAKLYLNGVLVTDLVISNTITQINDCAFWSYTSLTSVTIPDSVTTIGMGAFSDCRSLTSVTIPDSVISIGDYAFRGCTSLTSVEIPSSVTTIGIHAFSGCTSLTIYCEAPSKPSGWYSIWNSSDRPVVWDYDKFTYTVSGTNATITDFTGTATELVIPSTIDGYTVTGVGASTFFGCTSLTSVTIPSSVTTIGIHAFADCTSLTSITIPNSVTSIGDFAFSGCPIENATIPTNAISSVLKDNLKTVVINGGDAIEDYSFYCYTSLTSVTIPSSVTSIGDSAFYYCTSLISVEIPSSVTAIGEQAFSGCASLTSVTIPDSVTSIGWSAFYGCDSLTIYCEAPSQPSGWDSDWNSSGRPVVWGHTQE